MSEVLIEIAYDGEDLFEADGSVGFGFTRGSPGEPPAVRGEDDVVAAAAGRVPYARVADVLPIGLFGWLHAPDGLSTSAAYAAVETRRRSLLELFDTTAAPAVLSATLPDGATATISARVLPPVMIRTLVPGLRYEFDIALESVDPSWVVTPGP